MITSKISIGVFLLRLTPHRIHHWIIYIVMVSQVCSPLDMFSSMVMREMPLV